MSAPLSVSSRVRVVRFSPSMMIGCFVTPRCLSIFVSLFHCHAELFELRGTTRPEYLTIDEA
eukprot:COSAG06_NODE_62964_length_263_cov_1.243902_1_plen_61_part_10